MLDAAKQLEEYAEGKGQPDFADGTIARLATERLFEILGMAAMRVSPELRAAHPEIPWQQIVGLRNVIAHQYDDIIFDRLWEALTEHVPELIQLLEPLIPSPPEMAD
jgi:uncharacterized protein with HEPN domain